MIQCRVLFYFLLFLIISIINCENVLHRTKQGIIEGRKTSSTFEYLGIQYAKADRWKPAVDQASETFSNGYLNATSFGPCCPQLEGTTYIPSQDEQCLNLNIYQPIVPSKHSLMPVLVWIHGGGHRQGCSSQSIPLLFNGTNMILNSPSDQPTIVITLNYRLGIFADMFLTELTKEDPKWPTAGNYMYSDMLSALRWVQKNIRDYGGDPTNVTIFGESAGGLSVVDLGALRGSQGLFRTMISQSALDSPGKISSYYDMETALENSTLTANRVNCTGQNEYILTCLRNVPVKNLLEAYGTRRTRPIIDRYFFPLYPPLAIQEGLYGNLGLTMGNNYYEFPICSQNPDMDFIEALGLISQHVEEKWIAPIVDSYGLYGCFSDRNQNVSRCCDIARIIIMDQIFDCDIMRILDAFFLRNQQINAGNQLFWYNLNCYPGVCPPVENKGVCEHGSEQPYVFGTESDWSSVRPINCTWDNQSRIFSNNIIAQWMNIANTGRPLSSWPDYLPYKTQLYRLTPDHGFLPDTWNRNCTLFDAIEAEHVQKMMQKNNRVIF